MTRPNFIRKTSNRPQIDRSEGKGPLVLFYSRSPVNNLDYVDSEESNEGLLASGSYREP